MKFIAAAWFLVAVGLVAKTWLGLLFDVVADWVIDSIDWRWDP